MTHRVRDRVLGPEDEDPSRWRLSLQASYLPERYWSSDPERILEPTLRSWVRETLESAQGWMSRGAGLYVHGPLNTGKSSLASIMLMEAVRRCARATWMPVRIVPACKFRETPDAAARYERARTSDLLVLDDLGAESFRRQNAAGGALEELIRELYDRKRSVVVTSNVPWSELAARYGGEDDPLVSVLRRMVIPVPMYQQWPLGPEASRG